MMKKSTKKINTIISHYKLGDKGKNQGNVDFFNVNLDKDNLGFFDYNRIIKGSSEVVYKQMGDNIRSFQLALFTEATRGNAKGGLELLSGIKEINATRLGYSKGNSDGVSIGKKMKPIFLSSLGFLRDAYKKDQISFNTLRFGIKNISYDRISDICVSVNMKELVDYTIRQCKLHQIPCDISTQVTFFDLSNKIWKREAVKLPEYKGKPVVFIPKKLISSRTKAIFTLEQFVSFGFKKFIKYYSELQHLKNAKGEVLYKDYEEYLKKKGISKKEIAAKLMAKHDEIVHDFEQPRYVEVEELSTEELERITFS